MPPENMHLYNIRMRPSLWERARAHAEADGRRLSEVIRDLVADYVSTKDRAVKRQEGKAK